MERHGAERISVRVTQIWPHNWLSENNRFHHRKTRGLKISPPSGKYVIRADEKKKCAVTRIILVYLSDSPVSAREERIAARVCFIISITQSLVDEGNGKMRDKRRMITDKKEKDRPG